MRHARGDDDEVAGLDIVDLIGDLDVQDALEHPVELIERVDVPRGPRGLGRDVCRVDDDARAPGIG